MIRWMLCLFSLVLAGCQLPAQMVWSPDGSKAIYRVGERLTIIDGNGKALIDPLPSLGGMAWRADSKTAYIASIVEADKAPKNLQFESSPSAPTTTALVDSETTIVSSWADGVTTPLFTLPGRPVWHMALSPDENWLAVIQAVGHDKAECALFAFHLPSKKLISISSVCAVGMCFTGPSRLAFVEPEENVTTLKGASGHVVEIQLGSGLTSFERKHLMNVRCDETAWIQPLGDDMLLTATSTVYPSRAMTGRASAAKLFHFSRADGGICAIAEDVGPLFTVSPDGKQILIEKLTPLDAKTTRRELVLIRPNGSDGRVLRDISSTPDLPMWPSWKSNSEIAFTAPKDPMQPMRMESDQTVRFDLVLYRLNEMFELQPVRTLSDAWPMELKPFYEVKPAPPATLPTTMPATQAAAVGQ